MFNGSLAGFDKEMRELVLEAIQHGWRGRLSGRGHAILSHPSGLTVAVSKDARNLTKARTSIKRVEIQSSVGSTWTPVGASGQIEFNGDLYRCVVCNEVFVKAQSATGHYAGNHVDREKMTEGKNAAKRRRLEEQKINLQLELEQLEEEQEQEKEFEMPESETPFIEISDLPESRSVEIDSAQALAEWLAAMPSMSVKVIIDLVETNNKLKADNDRLREAFKTLADLAQDLN